MHGTKRARVVWEITHRAFLALAMLYFFPSQAHAQSKIEELSETRFGNVGGSGYVEAVMAGPQDRTIVVGSAYVPDPKRAGKTLTTLTYTEIAANGRVLVEKNFGRAPALSVSKAVHGNGTTYLYGFNAPSLFSDNPDTWVAAIELGGTLKWRKPVDEKAVGDLDLFIEPSGRLIMAGQVKRGGPVGIIPWSADGVMGSPQIFGTIKREGWGYPYQRVRSLDNGGVELLFARSSKTEVRVDRLTADPDENWTATVPWAQQRHPEFEHPTNIGFRNLGDGGLILTWQKGELKLNKQTRRYEGKGNHFWMIALDTERQPRLRHIDSQSQRQLIHIDRLGDGRYRVFSNALDLKNVTSSKPLSGLVGYARVMTLGDGHPTTSSTSNYSARLHAVDTSDIEQPVMFGFGRDYTMGKKAGFAVVLTNYIMFGTGKTYASNLFGVFEDIKHTRRASNGDMIVVTHARSYSTLNGPVFRTFRITPGVKP